MTNNKIMELRAKLDDVKKLTQQQTDSIAQELQKEYNKVFDDSKDLTKAIANADNSSMYQQGNYGEIESWFRYSKLADYADCREYFETWLSDRSCMRVDWDNDCLIVGHGDDNIIIQDEHGRDNGVWQGSKLIISESEYKNDDGEVNEAKRNALIEAHMEKTGYFPGVFRLTYHGDVYLVQTKSKDGTK
jgi:hypothetical protein